MGTLYGWVLRDGWRVSPGGNWRARPTFDRSGWFAVNLAADALIQAKTLAEVTEKVRDRSMSGTVACGRCGRVVLARQLGGASRHKRFDTGKFCRMPDAEWAPTVDDLSHPVHAKPKGDE